MSGSDSECTEAQVLELLGEFQLLEYLLKCYLAQCELVRAYEANEQFDSDFLEVDLPNRTLGLLLKRLRQVNDNERLHSGIQQLLNVRDDLAHRSLLRRYPDLPLLPKLSASPIEFEPVIRQLLECRESLFEDIIDLMNRFRAAGNGFSSRLEPPVR